MVPPMKGKGPENLKSKPGLSNHEVYLLTEFITFNYLDIRYEGFHFYSFPGPTNVRDSPNRKVSCTVLGTPPSEIIPTTKYSTTTLCIRKPCENFVFISPRIHNSNENTDFISVSTL